MKKKLILSIAILGYSLSLMAQSEGFKYGARFGVGKSMFTDSRFTNQQGRIAFNVGFTSTKQFNKHFALSADVLFTSKGSGITGTDTVTTIGSRYYAYERTFGMYYAEIPIMAKITLGSDDFYFSLFAGPSINFKLAALDTKEYTSDASYNSDNGYVRRTIPGIDVAEFTGVAGIGINAKYGEQVFFIDGRFSSPLTKAGTIDGKEINNQYFTIGIGYIY